MLRTVYSCTPITFNVRAWDADAAASAARKDRRFMRNTIAGRAIGGMGACRHECLRHVTVWVRNEETEVLRADPGGGAGDALLAAQPAGAGQTGAANRGRAVAYSEHRRSAEAGATGGADLGPHERAPAGRDPPPVAGGAAGADPRRTRATQHGAGDRADGAHPQFHRPRSRDARLSRGPRDREDGPLPAAASAF